jgi:hypothetical protein
LKWKDAEETVPSVMLNQIRIHFSKFESEAQKSQSFKRTDQFEEFEAQMSELILKLTSQTSPCEMSVFSSTIKTGVNDINLSLLVTDATTK